MILKKQKTKNKKQSFLRIVASSMVCVSSLLSTSLISSCGNRLNSSENSIDKNKTYLSFSISPDKTSYEPGEKVTITCKTTGPENVGVSWKLSNPNGSLVLNTLPETTDEECIVTTGDKGFYLEVTGEPDKTFQKDGVDMITVSGKNSFVIKVD